MVIPWRLVGVQRLISLILERGGFESDRTEPIEDIQDIEAGDGSEPVPEVFPLSTLRWFPATCGAFTAITCAAVGWWAISAYDATPMGQREQQLRKREQTRRSSVSARPEHFLATVGDGTAMIAGATAAHLTGEDRRRIAFLVQTLGRPMMLLARPIRTEDREWTVMVFLAPLERGTFDGGVAVQVTGTLSRASTGDAPNVEVWRVRPATFRWARAFPVRGKSPLVDDVVYWPYMNQPFLFFSASPIPRDELSGIVEQVRQVSLGAAAEWPILTLSMRSPAAATIELEDPAGQQRRSLDLIREKSGWTMVPASTRVQD